MRKFDGEWKLKPIIKDGQIIGTQVELIQEAMPLIIPSLLTSFVQGIATNAVIRLVEDLQVIIERYKNGEGLEDILQQNYLDGNPWLKQWRLDQGQEWDSWQSHMASNKNLIIYSDDDDNNDDFTSTSTI